MCHLFKNIPSDNDISISKENFQVLKVFIDENHLWRYLLKCQDCGQLYFYEFFEEIDWEKGNDPQFTTFIPVNTPDEAELISKKSPLELLLVSPRLQQDFGKGNDGQIRWIK